MVTKMTALAAYRAGRLRLPPGYRIASATGLLTVRRADDSIVAVFVSGTAPSRVARTVEDDYRAFEQISGA